MCSWYSLVQFSRSVVSDTLGSCELQHASPPCPSPTLGVHPNPCPSTVMPSNHLIVCRPLLLLPSIFPSIRVFSNESALCIKVYSKHIHNWFHFITLQELSGEHHCLKASILWHSAFFMVQHSYPYMTTGKPIALTRWTFVVKVMSLF